MLINPLDEELPPHSKIPSPWLRKPRAKEAYYLLLPTFTRTIRTSHPSADSSHHDDYYQ